ncbi:family 43 glycosylhydrolase [Lederbergia sp. NSJ-179]|uniref:family 43 glycosylhydrolase n=1 Tax=Lederbergia sp. NSJ-179 TaxID=2931402 RepID=UPI001FD00C3D|nr:family 43 glycosylhydrolase [Lederbergia sp. NSJ-179]MCJ7842130.1 family 43 glycosylhydrolase [Lederbergia sp. NSJ-179]
MSKTNNSNHLYYQPKGYWVGDIMPWGKDGKFYLYDQRDNRNPGPFGEPFGWSLATTEDFVHYEDFGDSIKKGDEDSVDQFIFAGSVFEANGKGHAFYTGYNRNWAKEGKVSQVLLHAYSDDLITWHKSNKLIELAPQPGYDPQDWRDPWVVWNENKQEYLLILGTRLEGPKTKMTGRLVHFSSKDLENWEFKGDFWAPNIYTMFEMPDLFKMGDYWYLVYTEYSDQSKTRYVMSKNIDGPWMIPSDDSFDGRPYYAARTAFDGKRRVLFGWVATKENNDDMGNFEWAGAFVPHEVYQREDHTLGVKPVDSLWNSFTNKKEISNRVLFAASEIKEEVLIDEIDNFFAFETNIKFSKDTRSFSLRLFKDEETDESYEFTFSLVDNELSFDKSPCYPWYQMMNKGLQRPIRLKEDQEYNLKLIVDHSIFTIYIDGVALNVRGYKKLGNKLSVTVMDGQLELTEIKYANKLK